VWQYYAWSPISRGKHWLLKRVSKFLVAPIDSGVWIRVSGVSGFEWKMLCRKPCEKVTSDFIRRILAPGMVMFDVGANVGYYALTAAKRVNPGGRVFAFEAAPAVAERLRENVVMNGLGNVSVIHGAVCDRDGEIEVRIHRDDSEGNSLVDFAPDWEAVRVPAITLDDFAARQHINRVDVMKIDVEGAEHLVLSGASGLLSRPGRPVIVLEMNPSALRAGGSSCRALVEQLASFGYRCHKLEQLTFGPEPVWNNLALHSEHHRSPLAPAIESAMAAA
jgi:FkbM family methyltransferase